MAENKKLKVINDTSESKQQLAYEQLKQDILNNIYPVGTMLTERKLCEIYNVSRSPIRNALQQLTHEGLLSLIPGKGATVTGFSLEDIFEVYDLIEVLQIYAVRTLIRRMDSTVSDQLENLLSHMEETIKNGDIAASTKWDQDFHHYLITASGNKRLLAMYDQLHVQSIRFIATAAVDDGALAARSCQEHRSIYSCMKNHDMDQAEQCIHKHYKNIRQYYMEKLLNPGAYEW